MNNTKYPTNDCNSQIYPYFRFSLINSLKAKFSVSVNYILERTLVLFLVLDQSHDPIVYIL